MAKIKAEIERLKKTQEVSEDKDYAQYELDVSCGYNMACDDILSFLSILEPENPIEGLEEEIERWWGEEYMKNSEGLPILPIVQGIARHFAQWGAEHLAGVRKMIETPVSDNLDKAARKSAVAPFNFKLDEEHIYEYPYLPIAEQKFKEGAKWQKDQDDRLVDIIYQQGIEKGKDDIKEQMMKEAVEGKVIDFRYISEIDYASAKIVFTTIPKLKEGDEVRIIIVKEDEK